MTPPDPVRAAAEALCDAMEHAERDVGMDEKMRRDHFGRIWQLEGALRAALRAPPQGEAPREEWLAGWKAAARMLETWAASTPLTSHGGKRSMILDLARQLRAIEAPPLAASSPRPEAAPPAATTTEEK